MFVCGCVLVVSVFRCLVLVVGSGETTPRELKDSRQELGAAELLGVVLNKVDKKGQSPLNYAEKSNNEKLLTLLNQN